MGILTPNATSEEKQLCKCMEHFLENNLHLGFPFNDIGKKWWNLFDVDKMENLCLNICRNVFLFVLLVSVYVVSFFSFFYKLAFAVSYTALLYFRQQLKTHGFHFLYKSLSRKKKYFELSQSWPLQSINNRAFAVTVWN